MKFFLYLTLFVITAGCSKKSEEPEEPGRPKSFFYLPTQSATYDAKFIYGHNNGDASTLLNFWAIDYDSAGVERWLQEPGNNVTDSVCAAVLEHSDFLKKESIEIPDSVYVDRSPARVIGDVAEVKKSWIYFTNPAENNIVVTFDNGVVLTFRITSATIIGGNYGEPFASSFRNDKSKAIEYYKKLFNQIQQRRDAPMDPGGRRWGHLIGGTE